MRRAGNCFFDFVSMIFFTLSGVVLMVVISVATDTIEPPVFAPRDTATAIPVAFGGQIPSLTPSNTPTETLTFTPSPTLTWTPLPTNTQTSTPTETLTPTQTNTPSITPSLTNTPSVTPSSTTPPTATPTRTNTPTPTNTSTATPTPTGPPTATTSPFIYSIQPPSPVLRDNFANQSGCNWQGLAGQITTVRGEPVIGVEVRAIRQGFPTRSTLSGTNLVYGASGWEIVVDVVPSVATYQVALFDGDVQISPSVTITFPGTCTQNLATINFIQRPPF